MTLANVLQSAIPIPKDYLLPPYDSPKNKESVALMVKFLSSDRSNFQIVSVEVAYTQAKCVFWGVELELYIHNCIHATVQRFWMSK